MSLDVWSSDAYHAAVEMSLVPIVLSDPHQHDCPIIFANGAFSELTGYRVEEIIGRNCRFLQGPETDRKAVERIQAAVAARWHVTEEIVNYKKDGTPFWNALFVNPVFDQSGRLVYLFGTQLDVTRRRRLEDVLRASADLLAIVDADLGNAIALSTNDVQRSHLLKVNLAIGKISRHQSDVLGNTSAFEEKISEAVGRS